MKETGTKFDAEKDRWDLLPLDIIREVVHVFTLGAKKYSVNNWKLVENGRERYYSALLRHLEKWQSGESHDPEWNTPHLAHIIFNAIALRYFEKLQEKGKRK